MTEKILTTVAEIEALPVRSVIISIADDRHVAIHREGTSTRPELGYWEERLGWQDLGPGDAAALEYMLPARVVYQPAET